MTAKPCSSALVSGAAAEVALRRRHHAVGAAVGLVEEAAVPCLRQPHLEADGERRARNRGVGVGALKHAAGDQAVLADRRAADGECAGRHGGGRSEGRVGVRQPRRQVAACPGVGRWGGCPELRQRHRRVVVVAAGDGAEDEGQAGHEGPARAVRKSQGFVSWWSGRELERLVRGVTGETAFRRCFFSCPAHSQRARMSSGTGIAFIRPGRAGSRTTKARTSVPSQTGSSPRRTW